MDTTVTERYESTYGFSRSIWLDALFCLVVGIAAAVLSIYCGSRLSIITHEQFHDIWFDADADSIFGLMTSRLFDDQAAVRRHPLVALLTTLPISLIGKALRVTPNVAVESFMATAAAVSSILVYLIARRIAGTPLRALIVTAFHLVSSAFLFWCGTPETLLPGQVALLAPLCVVAYKDFLPKLGAWTTLSAALSLAVTSTNWMSGIIAALVNLKPRQAIQAIIFSFVIVVLCLPIQGKFAPSTTKQVFLFAGGKSDTQWVNHPDSQGFRARITSLGLHSVLIPEYSITKRADESNRLNDSLSVQALTPKPGPLYLVSAALWLTLLAFGLFSLVLGSGPRSLRVALAALTLAQVAFLSNFGRETFLYAAYCTPLLILVAACGMTTRLANFVGGATLVLTALAAANNVPVLQSALKYVNRYEDHSSDMASRYAYGFTEEVTASADSWQGVLSPNAKEWKVRPGFAVELVAKGLELPVNMAFLPRPGTDPDSPVFYVNELHGRIKYMGKDGKIHTFANGLNNLEPVSVAKSDETGVSGLSLIPESEDLLVTTAYKDATSGLLSNRILRLVSEPGGKKLKKVETILDLKEFTSPSNQIQQILVGPDGKLYVSVGDAENHQLSLSLQNFGGKILRLNMDGSACEDNPFFESSAPESPRSYVLAYGVRNVFDMDFVPGTKRLVAVDNGKHIDRLFEATPGANFGWDGTPESIRLNALFSWGPVANPAPVGLSFLQKPALGDGTAGSCYVALYGPPGESGPNHAKSIVEFVFDPRTHLPNKTPQPLVQYAGDRKTTVLGLAEGPDGLYFTDFFGDAKTYEEDLGRIWKVVPSKATLGLPEVANTALDSLPPAQRGRLLFRANCMVCHTMDGAGGHEGPELTNVMSNLARRLGSQAYDASVVKLLEANTTFLVKQRPRLKEVLDAKGPERTKLWLKHHLEEPRFDHLYSKMPSFDPALKPEQRNDIISYLLSRK